VVDISGNKTPASKKEKRKRKNKMQEKRTPEESVRVQRLRWLAKNGMKHANDEVSSRCFVVVVVLVGMGVVVGRVMVAAALLVVVLLILVTLLRL
jgi:Flp pilus assembly protein TadB